MSLLIFVISITCAPVGVVFTSDFGSFWQITDLHYDPKYSINGDKNNRCHVTADGTRPLDPPGMFGDTRCEAPWALVESAVKAMKVIHPKPDFVLWSGDTGALFNKMTQNQLTSEIKSTTELLLKTFNGTQIIPVLGNNDVIPARQMPPTDQTYYQDILKNGGWDKMLPVKAQKTFAKGGYYSLDITPRLSVVVLNTALYYKENHLTKRMDDPTELFAWLKEYLNERKHIKHKVILAAHVPPGAFERMAGWFHMYPQFNQEYVDVVRSFSDVIGSQILSHERNDTLRLFLGLDGKPINVGILAPPVSPYAVRFHKNVAKDKHPDPIKANPGIRLIKYDRDSGNVLDIFQYYLNLDKANKAKKADWRLEYQFTKAMSVKNLKPISVNELVGRLGGDSANGLDLFHTLYSWNRIPLEKDTSCVGYCRKVYLCAVQHVDMSGYNTCLGTSTTPATETSTPGGSAETIPTHPITNSSNNNPYYPSSLNPYHRGSVPESVIYLVMTIGLLMLVAFLGITIYIHKRRKLYPKISYQRVPEFDYD